MIEKLPKPSEQHDICLFVLGGSHHYSGQASMSRSQMLDEHVKDVCRRRRGTSPPGRSLLPRPRTLFRLQYWTKSAALLDSFLKDVSGRGLERLIFPFALFDRSNCHFAEEEYPEALGKGDPGRDRVPRVLVRWSRSSLSKETFLRTPSQPAGGRGLLREGARARGDEGERRSSLVRSLLYLVNILGAEKVDNGKPIPDVQKALPLLRPLLEVAMRDSPYRAQVAVTGLPAMRAGGRIEEGLESLQECHRGTLQDRRALPGLSKSINSYTEVLP